MRIHKSIPFFLLLISWYVIADASIVARWRMDDATGTNAADHVGTLPGTLQAGASFTTTNCKRSSCVSLNGTDTGYIAIPSSPTTLNLTTAFSLVVWALPASLAGTPHILEKTVAGAANSQWSLFIDASLWKFRVKPSGAFVDTPSNGVPSTTAMTHVVVTYDNATTRMYINSVLQTATSSVTGPLAGGTGVATIGRLIAAAGFSFQGTVDLVEVYNHTLSQGEVNASFLQRPRYR